MISLIQQFIVKTIKYILYGKRGEPFIINSKKYNFELGSRPIRSKYINSKNIVVRNDVLQFKLVSELLKENSIFWDIGSHYGTYSILAAAYISDNNRIFAFEPDTEAILIFNKNIQNNGLQGKISLLETAVYSSIGIQEFDMQFGNSNSHLINKGDISMKGALKLVKTTTLNEALKTIPMPSIIKIDTEGAELEIIKGATDILRNQDTIFICELHPYAWGKDIGLVWNEFIELVQLNGRTIKLIDSQKSLNELPFYGTILF